VSDDRAAVITVSALLLTVASVAELLDCSPWAVRQRIREGLLPAVREHGRLMVRADVLRAYVDALEAAGAAAQRPPAIDQENLRIPLGRRGPCRYRM
jgi:hypothetical protein